MGIEIERLDTAAKVVALMEALARCESGLSLRELASLTSVPRSTAHRLLVSLTEAGWTARDGDDHFRTSLRFLLLGRRGSFQDVLIARVATPMRALALRTGKTVLMSLLDGDHGLCAHTEEPEMAVKFVAHRGMAVPLHAGATGKILLSWAPPEIQDRVIAAPPARPDGRRQSSGELRAEVAMIRERGWDFSQEEWIAHAADLSVPLFDRSGVFVAQLGLAGLAGTFQDHFDDLLADLQETARAIALHL